MSYWTTVRIMYDVSKGHPRKEDACDDNSHYIWNHIGITQIFDSFMEDYCRPRLEEIGSEGGATIELKELKTSGMFASCPLSFGHNLTIREDAILTIVGELRDCYKDDFVATLNKFMQYLKDYYGIYVTAGLVKIDGTSIHSFSREQQLSYYKHK